MFALFALLMLPVILAQALIGRKILVGSTLGYLICSVLIALFIGYFVRPVWAGPFQGGQVLILVLFLGGVAAAACYGLVYVFAEFDDKYAPDKLPVGVFVGIAYAALSVVLLIVIGVTSFVTETRTPNAHAFAAIPQVQIVPLPADASTDLGARN